MCVTHYLNYFIYFHDISTTLTVPRNRTCIASCKKSPTHSAFADIVIRRNYYIINFSRLIRIIQRVTSEMRFFGDGIACVFFLQVSSSVRVAICTTLSLLRFTIVRIRQFASTLRSTLSSKLVRFFDSF